MTAIGLRRKAFPHRTVGETSVCVTGSALVIALLAGYVQHVGGWQHRSPVQVIVLALIIFDLIFGMFIISAASARRWYHRPGADAQRFRVVFVVGHLPYLIAGSALFDTGWGWALANAALLLGAAAAVEATPVEVKRGVAIALTSAAALVNLIWLPLPAALAWLPVLLFVKILVCFLLPDPWPSPVRTSPGTTPPERC